MKFLVRLILTGIAAWFVIPVILTLLFGSSTVLLAASIFAGWPLLMVLWYRSDARYLRNE